MEFPVKKIVAVFFGILGVVLLKKTNHKEEEPEEELSWFDRLKPR